MVIQWKRLTVDIAIILISGTIIAILFNELRGEKIPLFPPYLNSALYKKINLSTFQQTDHVNSNCLILDARPHELYEKSHLDGALNLPVSNFDFFYHLHLADASPEDPIFVYGRTKSRAFDSELAYRLASIGHKNVTVLHEYLH